MNTTFLEWCTVLGTIFGFISLIASFWAVKNTNTISKAITKSKMNNAFKKEYKILVKELNTHISVLNENDTSDKVIYALFDTISRIKSYSDSGIWDDKKKIADIYNFLNKNLSKFKANAELYNQLKKNIILIKTIIEKEGKLHDL